MMRESSRTASIEAECLFFIITAIATTALRVISRIQSKAGLWWDDYLSIVALVCHQYGSQACAAATPAFKRLAWGWYGTEWLIEMFEAFVIALNCLGYAGMS